MEEHFSTLYNVQIHKCFIPMPVPFATDYTATKNSDDGGGGDDDGGGDGDVTIVLMFTKHQVLF